MICRAVHTECRRAPHLCDCPATLQRPMRCVIVPTPDKATSKGTT